MKLQTICEPTASTIIREAIWHTYKPNQQSNQTYNYYVDMDGVLVDLASGITKYKIKKHWRSPEALIEAISQFGNISDEKAVYDFYTQLQPTQEANTIWAATTQSGPTKILTALPPLKYGINQQGLIRGKTEWVQRNLNPQPLELLFSQHGEKQKYIQSKNDVLIDDLWANVEKWQKKGGSAIYHQSGNARSTLTGIQNPEGELDFEIDLQDKGPGISTDLPEFKGGGRLSGFPKYIIDDIARHMTTRTYKIKAQDENGPYETDVEVWATYQTSDEDKKKLIGLFKKLGIKHNNIDSFINLNVQAMYQFATTKYRQDAWPRHIILPASTSGINVKFANAMAEKFKTSPPQIWPKNTDIDSYIINMDGAKQCAETKTKKGEINPIKKEYLDKKDPRVKEWTPEEVEYIWRLTAYEWASGNKRMQDLDEFVRRGNLLNLFVPQTESFHDEPVMIIDDVTTFGTTIKDIATSITNLNASAIFGAVIWAF